MDNIDPVKYAKAGIYTFMRDELDRKTTMGQRIAYIFGTDYTDNIQETDRRKLLDGIVEWKPNLLDGDHVAGKKKKKKKKQPSSEWKAKALEASVVILFSTFIVHIYI